MGRKKSSTEFQQAIVRLLYDTAVHKKPHLLSDKPSDWSKTTTRDGGSDEVGRNLKTYNWFNKSIPLRSNAIWRIAVKDRVNLSTEELIAQRAEDLRLIDKWFGSNEPGEQVVNDMIQEIGIGLEIVFENGPLGGRRPVKAEASRVLFTSRPTCCI